jgi:hypothetical protein
LNSRPYQPAQTTQPPDRGLIAADSAGKTTESSHLQERHLSKKIKRMLGDTRFQPSIRFFRAEENIGASVQLFRADYGRNLSRLQINASACL